MPNESESSTHLELSPAERLRIENAFLLDPTWTYLNHGSYGACPRAVLNAQRDLRNRLEQQPVRFFMKRLFPLLDRSRDALARFIHADPEDLVFVSNATTGVNTVLRSLNFKAGDELLTTNHDYLACRRAMQFVAERSGAKLVIADVPFPISSPQQVTEAILAATTNRTKLVLLDAVTSATGLIFPLKSIIAALQQRGIETLIDGAHALAMLEINLQELRPTYFTANCHKWLCSPKGAGILYVDAKVKHKIHPLVISYGGEIKTKSRSIFHREFDWTGTQDPTAYIAAETALRILPKLVDGGWPKIREHNHRLVCAGRKLLLDALNTTAPCPDSMLGSLATVPLAAGDAIDATGYLPADPLAVALGERRIEVPVLFWPRAPRRWLRISAQVYNRIEHYEQLAIALHELQ